ncbi:hypothetical protein W97_02177 [Coniosporium apollinis CBS 100218]|uniref:EF-hand domain-containing protein n=1 Tax=Coniosporium apollinis (strain CBS 100218) TaxID=1168221 RepID=R7YMR7_CONA1|nr:uncharacterized protein W97_02177 [Coniosporium apollinis CBS 100218]EON62951.1 hypothetical protein W97_02177 [Coniosporium apollinis CBS 100218]
MAKGKVSDAVIEDHRELEHYYNNIMNAKDADTKERWQNQFVWELARHSIAEELVVYPEFEKNLPNGHDMAEKDRGDHRVVKEKLYKFQKLKADDPDFEPTLRDLWQDLSEHIKDEENNDLPALEKELSAADSESVANSFERTKMFVPTKSHPSAPDKPPYETVVGLMAAPMDRLMDMFKKFPKDKDEKVSP